MTCLHVDFIARVDVGRIVVPTGEGEPDHSANPHAFMAEIHVECADCHEPFVFVGARIGMTFGAPAMSADGLELRVPMRPQSADPHFGLGLPGFMARMREGEPRSHN